MRRFWIQIGANVNGPFTLEELRSKGINPNTLICPENEENWQKASSFDDVCELFGIKPKEKIPQLSLINNRLGLNLVVKKGEIIGRITGSHSEVLGKLSAISSKHLLFDYEYGKGWYLLDVGSSNGTRYNTNNQEWQNVPKITPNQAVYVQNKSFVVIGNIEFSIQIQTNE